ncbi:Ornithine carbamoyltransferase, partial [Durusdinium trenchii]
WSLCLNRYFFCRLQWPRLGTWQMRPRRLGAFCPWGGHRMALCFLMAFSTAWLAVWRQTSLLHETIWTPETQSPSVPLESEHEEAPEPDALPPALDEEGEESKGAPEEEALVQEEVTPAAEVTSLPEEDKVPQHSALLGVYQELCRMGLHSPGAIRLAPAHVRDVVVKLYQSLVERPPPAPFHRERRVHLKEPNCKNPAWRHLLDGSRRKTPRVVIDVTTGMGGGPELDLLEIRLWEINASLSHLPEPPPVKDVYVVSESAYGLRGDKKPLHFSRQKERFKDFLPQIEHVLLDNCSKYFREVEKMRNVTSKSKKRGGTMFSAEGIQRACVLQTLIRRRPDLPDDALVIFSDLDEVPSAAAIQMLRVCTTNSAAKEGPWVQANYPMPYNLRVGCKDRPKSQLHMQGAFATMGFLRRKKTLALRYNIRHNLIVPSAGIHLTYTGSRADVDYKLLHHGESGQILATKATAHGKRLDFCKIDDETVFQMEQLLRDNPVSVARAWERKSSILHKEPQGDLRKCQVPWALLTHPERYPHFWGKASGAPHENVAHRSRSSCASFKFPFLL